MKIEGRKKLFKTSSSSSSSSSSMKMKILLSKENIMKTLKGIGFSGSQVMKNLFEYVVRKK